MVKENILVVDDEIEIAELVEIYLHNEGYNVFTASDGYKAMEIMQTTTIHLVILDIMMPGLDGIELCKAIRKQNNLPIIMLSAKTQDIDKIYGLSTGADDYLTKPFNPLELMARVKSQLRRYLYLNDSSDKNVLVIGEITIDTLQRQVVTFKGREINLTPTEFEILLLLSLNKGIILSSEKIFEKVWKEKYFTNNNTVMVHIRNIREKIEEDPRHPQYIKTVWGVGYKIDG